MNNFPKSITIAFRDRQGLSKRAFVINDYLLVSHFGVDTSKYQLYWRRQKTPVVIRCSHHSQMLSTSQGGYVMC